MIKYTLYIGCNDKDKKVQVIPSEGIRSIITSTCMAAGLDGFTLSEASGFYKHDDGSMVIESTYRLEILFASDDVIRKILTVQRFFSIGWYSLSFWSVLVILGRFLTGFVLAGHKNI